MSLEEDLKIISGAIAQIDEAIRASESARAQISVGLDYAEIARHKANAAAISLDAAIGGVGGRIARATVRMWQAWDRYREAVQALIKLRDTLRNAENAVVDARREIEASTGRLFDTGGGTSK